MDEQNPCLCAGESRDDSKPRWPVSPSSGRFHHPVAPVGEAVGVQLDHAGSSAKGLVDVPERQR